MVFSFFQVGSYLVAEHHASDDLKMHPIEKKGKSQVYRANSRDCGLEVNVMRTKGGDRSKTKGKLGFR
jgi:hypothetical protein